MFRYLICIGTFLLSNMGSYAQKQTAANVGVGINTPGALLVNVKVIRHNADFLYRFGIELGRGSRANEMTILRDATLVKRESDLPVKYLSQRFYIAGIKGNDNGHFFIQTAFGMTYGTCLDYKVESMYPDDIVKEIWETGLGFNVGIHFGVNKYFKNGLGFSCQYGCDYFTVGSNAFLSQPFSAGILKKF